VSISNDAARTESAWTAVESFDGVGPFDRVYVLDAESGAIAFGDKVDGVPPADTERIVAKRYRHGGGLDHDVPVGLVNAPDALPPAVDAAINIVAARGGKDAESLAEAKKRAPKEMKSQRRAVTIGDFQFQATQTPGLRVGRAEVVVFHKPYPEGRLVAGTLIPESGLDLDVRVPGVVSVIVVPDDPGLYPTPTTGGLRKVCKHLDGHRLITTEVYATVPQYVRLSDFDIQLRADSGYTRTRLREAIAERLESYYHVLTGGEDGEGFPFGATVHHADLVAQIFKVEGVRRVESLSVTVDGRTPADAPVSMTWRSERLVPVRLVNCIGGDGEVESIVLGPDENVFIDASTVNVRFTGD
jgi:predicted phage baseplate assembly protein